MATTSKLERDRQKLVQDKCQQILADLLKDEDNKYCVDCDSKGKRGVVRGVYLFNFVICFFAFAFTQLDRTSMGLMELGHLSLHSMCRPSS